ncbi:MAG TPA: helix-turn-helix transcriptional regulator, partial [Phycisphaerales bacterium]|nr:helix-turn-helix transcriptional regulator [Phycisphaerales bacterium]
MGSNGAVPPPGSVGSEALGGAVRTRRRTLGLSLDAVAHRVGCSKSYLSTIETGRCGPPGEPLLRRLEEALGEPAGRLVHLARLASTPTDIRRELTELHQRQAAAGRVAELLRGLGSGPASTSLDE